MTIQNDQKHILSRRRLMQLSVAGVSTLALGSLLAACGEEDDDVEAAEDTGTTTSGAGSASTEATATETESNEPEPADDATSELTYTYAPQTGIERDEMIVGVQGLPATVDPAQELSNVGTRVNYTPYDTLIRRDFLNNNEHVPSLAVAWERVGDLVLELELRDDVVFHNGDPFTAEDVVFTFERLLEADAESPLTQAKSYFTTITSVEALDDFNVRFETAEPDPLLIKRLASWASWIVPKAHIEEVGQETFQMSGMGTGPFKFVSFDPDNELVLERHEEYWGEPVPVKRIVFRVIPEIAARVTALINDEVQLITNVPPDQVNTIDGADNVEVRAVPLANAHVLRYNTHRSELSDKKLRQALNLGIDRELIIETIWSGQAVAKRGHQFEEFGSLFNPDRPLTPYDPERARELVEESSYNGEVIEYQLQAGYYTNGEQVAQAIVPMWQEIGVNAEVRINENSTTGEDAMVHTWSNSSILADPDGVFWRSWGAETGVQKNYWDAPDEFNELGEEARRTLDEDKRFENYQRMLDIWEDEAPGTVLFDPVEFYGVNTSVNWSPYPFYYMDLRAYNLSFED